MLLAKLYSMQFPFSVWYRENNLHKYDNITLHSHKQQ